MIHIATATPVRILVWLAPPAVAGAACWSTGAGTFTPAGGTAQAFTFTANAEAEIEMEFPSPITVGPGTSNFTVSVDVASWFKDASGAFLDPNDPANAETINANIQHSFRAFRDEDHDGVDDDHEER